MQLGQVFPLSVILSATSAAVIIGVSAVVDVQDANAASDDNGDTTSSCNNHHPSDTSKKCSKNDTPLILPFP